MATKAQLKALNELIKKEQYMQAISQAREIIARDGNQANAHLLLGFALEKTEQFDEAEAAYKTAALLVPKLPAAWQGMCKLAERQGAKRLGLFKEALESLIPIFADAEEYPKAREMLERYMGLARNSDNKMDYVEALELTCPDNAAYPSLEGLMERPIVTYDKMITIIETEEKKTINRLIGERRTRLGAVFKTVSQEIKCEVFAQSKREHYLRQAINWCSEDDVRRSYEERLFQHCLEKLTVLKGGPEKDVAREKVLECANGMVVVKHPCRLGWEIALDWQDHKELTDYDVNILREYCRFFPDTDLAKVITGFLTSQLSPFPPEKTNPSPQPKREDYGDSSSSDEDNGGVSTLVIPTTEADRVVIMTNGIASSESLLAYRLVGAYYQYLEEWEMCAELMRKAIRYAATETGRCGMSFLETIDTYRIFLGTALVYYQSPRNHPEAMKLFEAVMDRDPKSTAAMIGTGLIFEEEEEFEKASDFLTRALKCGPTNIKVLSELGWVRAMMGQYDLAEVELRHCLELFQNEKRKDLTNELEAQVQYRIGFCIWHRDPSFAARESRKGAYSYFLAALKSDLSHAPSYTILGLYYADYAGDKKRARRCFQKALELSANEVVSAERLAHSYADDRDWEKVELIARRTVESGKVKPLPGSKRAGISWPFAAIGTACLSKHEYPEAIASFQIALRISPKDYHSWVSLGEGYYRSGRHVAAIKAITHAQSLEAEKSAGELGDTWFTQYLLANIKRELGQYDSAIELYREIYKTHTDEHGIINSLLQTLVDAALDAIEKALFGRAAQLARDVIELGKTVTPLVDKSFNFWKSMGDACSVFASVKSRIGEFPIANIGHIVNTHVATKESDNLFSEYDHINAEQLPVSDKGEPLLKCLHFMIVCQKRAIYVSASDAHAQAVAYYNLGWAEYKAHTCLPLQDRGKPSKFQKAAVRAFKRAIELEAKNSEFWNALGVVTSQINPRVAQHAFVRSLYLDERNSATWVNLGTLALMNNDLETASAAFTRAQSNDPDYANAWMGHGYIYKLLDDEDEFRGQAKHAMSLSTSSNLATRQQFSTLMFDHILKTPDSKLDVSVLVETLFALGQVKALDPDELMYTHMYTLIQERLYDHARAVQSLDLLCSTVEAQFEATEDPELLGRFVIAKADLARSYLASQDYENAIEAGEMAISLTDEVSEQELTTEQRSKARLSAHLTVGLAHYFNQDVESAVGNLQYALEETNGSPDAVCLLAQVLWATGTAENRDLACDKLFGVVNAVSDHVPSRLLLAVISVLGEDWELLAAVVADLNVMRMTAGFDEAMYKDIGNALAAIEALKPGRTLDDVKEQMQTDIMLHPSLPHGWIKLSEIVSSDATQLAQASVSVALKGVPPRGNLCAKDVALAYASTKNAADAQLAVSMAPWVMDGWQSLAEAVVRGREKTQAATM
ncbi:Superkiller protein 3 [Ceratocystis pirilliformis]|uniref:Superkiller protein 3 n=1 Tax=Ceratocystis pirilliformis TaxID=259994 RepID=A0ABR3Z699_9PEZI